MNYASAKGPVHEQCQRERPCSWTIPARRALFMEYASVKGPVHALCQREGLSSCQTSSSFVVRETVKFALSCVCLLYGLVIFFHLCLHCCLCCVKFALFCAFLLFVFGDSFGPYHSRFYLSSSLHIEFCLHCCIGCCFKTYSFESHVCLTIMLYVIALSGEDARMDTR